MVISHLNFLSTIDFKIGVEGSPIVGNVDDSACVSPLPLNLALDRHEFAHRSDYVSSGHCGVDLFLNRLAVSKILSIMTGFATQIASPIGPLGPGHFDGHGLARMLKFL